MAVGIYGGSFDPIHLGHLITTQSVYEKRGLEKIIFIPSHISPLKQDVVATSDNHRLKMAQLAIESIPYFEISDYEISKGDVSYSIDTIMHFKKYYNDIELIIGFDNLVVFDKWKEPDEIFDQSKVVVMKRQMDIMPGKQNKYFKQSIFVNTPNIDIASTEIRKRVKDKLPIDLLVSPKVHDYIFQNNLYK